MNRPSSLPFTGPAAVVVRRTVTAVVFVIAGLSFAFGFGNGWALGLQLGVSSWIAPLVAPAVDLSVVTLLASVHFLRVRGVRSRLVGARLLLVLCGLMTFALNTARPILARQVGRACFDAVAPVLLIGWGEVGPRLLALMHSAVPIVRDNQDEQQTAVPATQDRNDGGRAASADRPNAPDRAALPPALVVSAQQLAAAHRESTGRQITRDKLRAQLKVSNAVASELLRAVRGPPDE